MRTEPFILGLLGSLAFGEPISECQATDRSTFCPNARREVSSGLRCPPLRPFCLEKRGRQLRRLTLATAAACSSVIVGAMSAALLETRLNDRALSPLSRPWQDGRNPRRGI